MACSSCSTGGGLPAGCKNNGTCSSGGCDKLSVYDWLGNMETPVGQKKFDCVEVRFKNGRKEYCRNTNDLSIVMGDVLAVEGSPGHDIGTVSLTGELVRLQMRKRKIDHESQEVKKIYRKASQADIEKWQRAQEREVPTMYKAREFALKGKLNMKISDVEFQGDNNKATFYYTADGRVDFRMLIKDLAREFGVRIEMKQIGARQEAARLGGIGSCGRELCCTTWLTDFRSVNTAAARYQQLALNPQKLAGQCGKLKCCLNYELDAYLEEFKSFPDTNVRLKTEKGEARFVKMDIFRGVMWYCYTGEFSAFIELNRDSVSEILKMNKAGEKPKCLEDFCEDKKETERLDFKNVVGQDDLRRFDKNKPNANGRKGNRRKKRPNRAPKKD